ncbi:hypothetical protein [Vogesella sp. LIG4]|uniref:hypothetical protein n=1 Tax=Vogesella sp. LIG4 TaxID=1192162 RepID=UPI00081FBB7B|nr:hypothetical protein [Vogesella sp. LIG4]SCK27759.1 hypothetical protein PSELUDRAFT_3382 [Vogesella sp. LIG4]
MSMLDNLLKLQDGPRDGAMLRFGIANEYAHLQDWAQAASFARQAVERQHDFSAAWKLLGKALLNAGDAAAALAAYQEGIAIAEGKGDIQAAKEMKVFARRIEKAQGE